MRCPRGVPETTQDGVTLELYWPEGEHIANLLERAALAFRAAEDPDLPETSGGLQLATSTVVRYKQSGDNPRRDYGVEILDLVVRYKQSGNNPRKNTDYQALRPVWR